MHVISRAQLQAFVLGVFVDPDQQFQEELNVFVNELLTRSQAKWFVFSDNDNGPDPRINYGGQGNCEDILPLTYRKDGDSYYGISTFQNKYEPGPVIFYCFLGGSPLNSATGFYITEAEGM